MPRLTDARVSAIVPPRSGQVEYADDLVQGLRLRVGAGGRKSWIVRTRAGKKQINKTLGPYPLISLAAARDHARELLIAVAKEGEVRAKHTFGELADHWIEHVAKVRNKSWHNQKRRLELYVLPKWRNTDLASIRRADVRDLIDGIHGVVAPGRALIIIRTLFRYAMGRDWVEASPAEAIQAIAALCHSRSIDLAVFSRADIHRCYASVGAVTWQDIAESVGRQLEPLRQLVPERRKAWQSEARRMSIFAAAAVAMTYWQLAVGS